MNTERSLDLLERIAALVRSEVRRTAGEDGLEPVHIAALGYLARANRFSNHPLAVAEYLGLSKGNMSQRLNVLEREGLVRKSGDRDDGRKVHLEVTAKGRKTLGRHWPPGVWAGAEGLEQRLSDALRQMLAANGGRTFGECHTCRFHEAGPRCGLLGLALTAAQAQQICQEHEPREAA